MEMNEKYVVGEQEFKPLNDYVTPYKQAKEHMELLLKLKESGVKVEQEISALAKRMNKMLGIEPENMGFATVKSIRQPIMVKMYMSQANISEYIKRQPSYGYNIDVQEKHSESDIQVYVPASEIVEFVNVAGKVVGYKIRGDEACE
ncbi:hypothetical protein ADA01nite_40440 [Aneurinibacillus danicus]|uniref:Uncharacterized protein n=2 Tax=Aneurinibacillus danicus TaxID=267746 RepID=A0A511VCJ5_9BACL|nr:hypothetical protein ADA01nite_40440 [Aneurinibacillus danicus]